MAINRSNNEDNDNDDIDNKGNSNGNGENSNFFQELKNTIKIDNNRNSLLIFNITLKFSILFRDKKKFIIFIKIFLVIGMDKLISRIKFFLIMIKKKH